MSLSNLHLRECPKCKVAGNLRIAASSELESDDPAIACGSPGCDATFLWSRRPAAEGDRILYEGRKYRVAAIGKVGEFNADLITIVGTDHDGTAHSVTSVAREPVQFRHLD